MSNKCIDSGNNAAAHAARLAGVEVVAAYPITPQTPLTEKLSEWVASGEMDAEYVAVESEHSALGVCIGAASAGVRAFTATSANGLLYMSEQLHWAAGARLPLVMCVVNRGVGAPWSVWNDHQDAMSQRDTGWIQLFVKDHQEIVDVTIKAFRLAEAVHIPVMVNYDGYYLSHTYMPFELPDAEAVRAFLPPYVYKHALDPQRPENLNSVTLPDARRDAGGVLRGGYMDIRHNLQQEMHQALAVWEEIDADYRQRFGRGGAPVLEAYRLEDAEFVVVAMGTLANQFRDVVDRLRQEDGIRVGVLAVQVYRPFPARQLAEALQAARGVMVFEKGLSYGHQGALFADVKSALYPWPARPVLRNFIVGIGGREIPTNELCRNLKQACGQDELPPEVADTPNWIGLQL
ncbi:ketoisovalerate ferredoxin oxidoreductase alpha subunit [Geothermobacter ehrlichii]|uniref:Ketoisovalerate ferredoxin oxidoreductase alpha subunit n=1 Tax=Geothermobacter ehrlichii TaxID=213224 RepID=A0A5D3WH20_9BACT|nr:pyruvate ferredoxin oxidoreductase [Geothermobacter ehrlichii]TYO95773.1 ketoisovalerate ferredoxin oxidoreductase alpha subunit [Geothermobacter ehrlichii]